MDLIKVAWRNVGRNIRRSLITALTVFIGIMVVCSTRGLLNGLQGEIRGGLTEKIHGDLQMHKKGYQDVIDSDPYKIVFPFDQSIKDRLQNVEGILNYTPRLRILGLLNHQKTQSSTPVMIVGIDSNQELLVTPRLIQAVQMGKLLDSSLEKSALRIDATENLEAAPSLDDKPQAGNDNISKFSANEGYHQIMITPALMRGLQAEIGDEIVILVQDKNKMQQALVTKLTGVVDYALPAAASRMAWMDFASLQELTSSIGNTSEIAIKKDPNLAIEVVLNNLKAANFGDTIIETWLELAGFLSDILGLQNFIFSVIVGVVFLIMTSAIVNTSLMTVMERTKEIGTLMALGYRRKHIMFLFLAESAFICFIGGGLGAAVSMTFIHFLERSGIVITLPGQKVSTILYPNIPFDFVGFALMLAVIAGFIAALVPAYRASHLKPVEALSSN